MSSTSSHRLKASSLSLPFTLYSSPSVSLLILVLVLFLACSESKLHQYSTLFAPLERGKEEGKRESDLRFQFREVKEKSLQPTFSLFARTSPLTLHQIYQCVKGSTFERNRALSQDFRLNLFSSLFSSLFSRDFRLTSAFSSS